MWTSWLHHTRQAQKHHPSLWQHGTMHPGKGFAYLITSNIPAVERACVHDISSFVPWLHQHALTNSVKWIGSQPRWWRCEHSWDLEAFPLHVSDIEVGSSVDDNTLHRHIKALVQTSNPTRSVDLNEAVIEVFEFPFRCSFANISG